MKLKNHQTKTEREPFIKHSRLFEHIQVDLCEVVRTFFCFCAAHFSCFQAHSQEFLWCFLFSDTSDFLSDSLNWKHLLLFVLRFLTFFLAATRARAASYEGVYSSVSDNTKRTILPFLASVQLIVTFAMLAHWMPLTVFLAFHLFEFFSTVGCSLDATDCVSGFPSLWIFFYSGLARSRCLLEENIWEDAEIRLAACSRLLFHSVSQSPRLVKLPCALQSTGMRWISLFHWTTKTTRNVSLMGARCYLLICFFHHGDSYPTGSSLQARSG